jgi:hypothetical protein
MVRTKNIQQSTRKRKRRTKEMMIITSDAVYTKTTFDPQSAAAIRDPQSAAAIRDLGVLMTILKRDTENDDDDEEGTCNETPQGKCPHLPMLLEAYTSKQIQDLVDKLPHILSVVFIGRSIKGDHHILILADKPSMRIFVITLKPAFGVVGLVHDFRHQKEGTRLRKIVAGLKQLYLDESFFVDNNIVY